MKNLYIIRHAESSWEDPSLMDKKRPLNLRGLKDAEKMAERLILKNIEPKGIISSDALRAKHTATIFADKFKFSHNQIILTPKLYHADASQILNIVKSLPDQFQTVCLFAHNPGINELAWKLKFEVNNIPTTGILGIQFHSTLWEEISLQKMNIIYYDFPKNKPI